MPAEGDPVAGTTDCALPPPDFASASQSRPAAGRLAPGQLWQGVFRVGTAFGQPAGRWFEATNLGTNVPVWLRASCLETAGHRKRIWETIRALESRHLLKPLDAHTDIERVELWAPPAAPSLPVWRNNRPPPEPGEIRSFVRQLTAALELLHGSGLGHFAITPENIFVRTDASGPTYVLGGFDAVDFFDHDGLISIWVEPLSAPPEAAGLFKHSPGPTLLAWDWWSLGRALQEFILGHHVLSNLPGELSAKLLREHIDIPEALLFERDTGSLRAGAIELMPLLEKRTELLLRGLLTSSRDGRWVLGEVREWLAGGSPKERYSQPRQMRYFRVNGRSYSVPEAAHVLRGPEHFGSAVEHVFGADHPGTLANFLVETRVHDRVFEQAVKLPDAPALRRFPPDLVREIAAAVGLHALSEGEFLWRGQPLPAALRATLGDPPKIDRACQEVRVLGSPVVVPLLKAHDFQAAQLLETLVKSADEAEQLAVPNRWLTSAAKSERSALWLLALEPEGRLADAHAQLRTTYACTTHPALDKIFLTPHPTQGQLVLLAWMARAPERFNFLTHQEVKHRRLATLAENGRLVAQVIFWRRLERALRVGPFLFGERWPLLAGWMILLLLLAVHVAGPKGLALGLLPALALALVRFGFNRWQAGLLAEWVPGAAPWGWRHGARRCATEATTLAANHGLPATLREATLKLKKLNAELVEIAKPERTELVPWPPRHLGIWAAVALTWIAIAGLVGGSIWRGVSHPPSWSTHLGAWQKALHLKSESKENAAQEVKVSWPYKLVADSPFPPLTIDITDIFTPTSLQTRAALARGRELAAPYKQDTINCIIAIHVPVVGRPGALLLFDGRKNSMIGHTGIFVEFVPGAGSWLQLGDKTAIFIAP